MPVGVNIATAATAHISPRRSGPIPDDILQLRSRQLFTYLYFISEYTAPILMGFALWRSRSVPRWLAVLFTVGLEVAESAVVQGSRGHLVHAAWAITMLLLAARIWQSATQPAARSLDPVPEPVSI